MYFAELENTGGLKVGKQGEVYVEWVR